jgi:hypothetical protein
LSGNGYRFGPALLSSRSVSVQFLITLFEDHGTQLVQIVGLSEVVDRR